jgi:S-adenosylmethionine hydrolase
MNKTPCIVLLTDFGLTDAYVGTLKGVILSICPSAPLVDLTHAVEPQNIRQGAYLLMTAFRYFPADTIFLVVVDPGVGTDRRPIAVETDHGVYVAPNNGVLSYVLAQVHVKQAVVLHNPDYQLARISRTFHGRDIFSPAAAHLANGVPISQLGPACPDLTLSGTPSLEIAPGQLRGEVIHIDHFGNIITSIGLWNWIGENRLRLDPQFGPHSPLPDLDAATCQIKVGSQTVTTIRPTYGNVPPGTLTALIGSSGQLEVGINQGNAARELGVSLDDLVLVTFGRL